MSSNAPPLPARARRVLTYVLCRQKKVKCDQKIPCANYVISKVQCVPATLAQRWRRRRFSKRELLNRLRSYEQLLHQNNIFFKPIHSETVIEKECVDKNNDHELDTRELGPSRADLVPSRTLEFKRIFRPKYYHLLHMELADILKEILARHKSRSTII